MLNLRRTSVDVQTLFCRSYCCSVRFKNTESLCSRLHGTPHLARKFENFTWISLHYNVGRTLRTLEPNVSVCWFAYACLVVWFHCWYFYAFILQRIKYSYQQLMRLEMPSVCMCVYGVQFNIQLHYHYTYSVHTVLTITIRVWIKAWQWIQDWEDEKNILRYSLCMCALNTESYLFLLLFASNRKFHSENSSLWERAKRRRKNKCMLCHSPQV